MATKVLVIDDNELYRKAFRRNLMLQNYEVVEAGNADEAMKVYDTESPDLVVTDLSMRTPTEGLDVIRAIKGIDPLAPVVLISAVGTFEEGSLAKELGADKVLMKQKIDEQIEQLYAAIDEAKANGERLRQLKAEIDAIPREADAITPAHAKRLREIITTPQQHPAIMAEAYDVQAIVNERQIRVRLQEEFARTAGQTSADMTSIEKKLEAIFPELRKFDPETIKELRTAEYFFERQGGDNPTAEDFSRSIGFSFCFAVENEAKARLRKKLAKFLNDSANFKLVRRLIDDRTNQLDLFYHQYLLRLQQQIHYDFTIDNVRQVFQRILEHEGRYKPDGLKALGIMIVCFGRDYTLKGVKGQIVVANPLGIKSFDSDAEILRFAHLLVSLQHYRNPYIHPEISEMEKVSKIRETAFECLRMISRLV